MSSAITLKGFSGLSQQLAKVSDDLLKLTNEWVSDFGKLVGEWVNEGVSEWKTEWVNKWRSERRSNLISHSGERLLVNYDGR